MDNFNTSGNGLEKCFNIRVSAPDNFAPRKKTYSRGNNDPFMNKALKKTQMKRTRLRNSYLKKKNVKKKLLMIGNGITVFLLYKRQRETTTPI